jgi:hypothetical protein
MGDAEKLIGGIIVSVIALATLSVVLSNSANTTGVISSGFSGLSSLIKTAISPITG